MIDNGDVEEISASVEDNKSSCHIPHRTSADEIIELVSRPGSANTIQSEARGLTSADGLR